MTVAAKTTAVITLLILAAAVASTGGYLCKVIIGLSMPATKAVDTTQLPEKVVINSITDTLHHADELRYSATPDTANRQNTDTGTYHRADTAVPRIAVKDTPITPKVSGIPKAQLVQSVNIPVTNGDVAPQLSKSESNRIIAFIKNEEKKRGISITNAIVKMTVGSNGKVVSNELIALLKQKGYNVNSEPGMMMTAHVLNGINTRLDGDGVVWIEVGNLK